LKRNSFSDTKLHVILSEAKNPCNVGLIAALWQEEKQAAIESIAIAKELALVFLASEREKIMRLSHEEALRELLRVHKIDSKIKIINAVSDNSLLEIR